MNQVAVNVDAGQQVAHGDAPALILLWKIHHRSVLKFIDRQLPKTLRPVLDPQDILQDTYFNAFRQINTLAPGDVGMVNRWLLTIARNQIVKNIRRYHAAKRGGRVIGQVSGNGSDEAIIELLEELVVYERTPSKSAIVHEMMGTLSRSMAQLPDAHRSVLRLRYFERLSIREIAEQMDRSEGAIEQLCHRALKSLRLELRSASHYV